MTNSIDYKFFFSIKKKLTPEQFFSGVTSLEEAKNLLDKNFIVNYDLEEISLLLKLDHKNDRPLGKTSSPPTNNLKKNRPTRKNTSTNKRSRSKKTPSKKSDSKELSDEEKEKDSSYFKTWKVPYVEP